MNEDVLAQVLKRINDHDAKRYVLAISGGVDSMVLWHLFKRSQKAYVVAHVHHHQRQASDEELAYIKHQCALENTLFFEHHLTLKDTQNFQAVARQARLTFFKKIAQQQQCDAIVLAHHADDQLETVIMRLLRRSYWRTWPGMMVSTPFHDAVLFRPLIEQSKDEITNYAETHHIHYFEDASNRSLRYTRNRVRHQTLPYLTKQNTHILPQLNELRTLVKRFDKSYNSFFKDHHQHKLNRLFFLSLPPRLQHTFFKDWLAYQGVGHLSRGVLRTLIQSITQQQKPLYLPLSKHTLLASAYDELYLTSHAPPQTELVIPTFGTYALEAHRWVAVTKEKNLSEGSETWELCYNKSTFPMTIRHRKPGDVILMSYGHKKLKDLLIDLKIPKPDRDRLWVVESNQKIVGILGLSLKLKKETCAHKIYLTEVSHDE